MADIPWDDARLFLTVAETGSVSAAARRLRLGQPTVSRRLAQLEYDLGFHLFHRGTAGTKLTAQGERLVLSAKRMSEWAGELNRAAEQRDSRPRGIVRVTAPPGVAYDFLAPFAASLAGKYPDLSLQVLSSVEYLDLARGEADLALRGRAPTQADLTSVASVRHAVAAFATRQYAATLPKKYGFADVGWIAWAPPMDQVTPNPQLAALIPDFKPVFAADDYLVQLRAAEAGLGAIVLGALRHRFSGPAKLVPLKLDLGQYARSELHLVCARSALAIPRVRIVAERIAHELSRVTHLT